MTPSTRQAALIITVVLTLIMGGSAIGQGIYLDHVDGLDPDGRISDEATLDNCVLTPITYCTPRPVILWDRPDLLKIHICREDPADVIMESIRVQGNIRPYEGYPIVEGDEIITACLLMRFIGSSGFRPIVQSFEAPYTVEYDKTDGTHTVLTGNFQLCAGSCEKYTADSPFDLDDIIFVADYFWRGGDTGELYPEEIHAMMDVDGNGQADPLDVIEMLKLAGYK